MDLERYTAKLVDRLTTAGQSEGFGALFVALLRALAMGKPASPTALASTLAWPLERVTTALADAVDIEWDADGSVVGYGLTLRETPHRFEINGRRLYTWCAFDTLFFPALIDCSAHVFSRCAATGAPITLTVTPEGIRNVEPAGAAVSMLLPQEDARHIRAAFCCHVHFFASTDVGRGWASTRPGVDIVDVHAAFEVGRKCAQTLLLAV